MRRWLLFFVSNLLLVSGAHASLNIEIIGGAEGAARIAIVPFGWQGQGNAPLDFAGVIGADLHRSGMFAPLAEKDMLERPHSEAAIEYKNWRILEVPSLVVGNVLENPGVSGAQSTYSIQFWLLDVYQSKRIVAYTLQGGIKDLRHRAHEISDFIYQALTGQRGAFATRIAYITKSRDDKGGDRYALEVADADAENPRPVLVSREPVYSPAWAPDSKRIAYVTMENKRQQVYVQDVATGKRELIANYMNYNGAPAWSPDGKKIALALSQEGNHEIYILDFDTRVLKRITRHWGIDTEPAWSPDGKSLVYTSEQGGSPQIYQYFIGSGEVKRLTFEGRQNTRASFSPDGKSLVFVHRAEDGQDHVTLMDMATGLVRVLTDTRLDESPSFAPNGSMIIYATTVNVGGKLRGVLAAVSVDGRVQQRFSLKGGSGDVREPTWAPYIQ